jgi:hypothetical protein
VKSGNSENERRTAMVLALKAAERVIPFFETDLQADNRPREAIEAGHNWLNGLITVNAARQAAFGAHAAARLATRTSARAAARSAGHAAATAHVVGHADAALKYAVLAQRIANEERAKT